MNTSDKDNILPKPNFQFSLGDDYSVRRQSTLLNSSTLDTIHYSTNRFNSYCNISTRFSPIHETKLTSDYRLKSLDFHFLDLPNSSLNNPLFSNSNQFSSDVSLCEKLGDGSFGDVYKMKDSNSSLYYAVKRIKHSGRIKHRNIQENTEVLNIRLLGDHLNLVRLHHVWEDHSYLFMQFDLCSTSLRTFLVANGPVPQSNLWWMLRDISAGLRYMHGRNYIHLDIKPDNLFLSLDRQVVKIGDFGLIFNLNKNQDDAIEGDSVYIAPELLRKCFGKPADVFSLGLTILELHTNVQLPKHGPLWHKLRHNDFSSISVKISRKTNALLLQMLQPSPQKRISIEDVCQFVKDQLCINKKFSTVYFHPFLCLLTLFNFLFNCIFSIIIGCSSIITKIKIFSSTVDMYFRSKHCSKSNNTFPIEILDGSQCNPIYSSHLITSTPLQGSKSFDLQEGVFSNLHHDLIES